MREVEIMSSFEHTNILTLIGLCPRGTVVQLLLNYNFKERTWFRQYPNPNPSVLGSNAKTKKKYFFFIYFLKTENTLSPWMVFEFMPLGDLASVLRKSSLQFWSSVPTLPVLSSVSILPLNGYLLFHNLIIFISIVEWYSKIFQMYYFLTKIIFEPNWLTYLASSTKLVHSSSYSSTQTGQPIQITRLNW